MLVTANARCTKIVVGFLAKSNVGKRRSLVRKIHTFRGESALSAWLQRLAVRVVLEATPDPQDEMLTGWW